MEKELGEPKERKIKVLVADDEESMSVFVGKKLLEEKMVLPTVIVGSAEKALEEIGKGGFTHVITDGFRGDWKKVAQAAQEKGIDITVLSGDEDVKEEVLKEKDIRFISKPMRLEQIREIFEERQCS